MLQRRNVQFSTTTLPLSRRQAPSSYSSSGQRCKLLFAFAIFIVLGIFIREREARIRRLQERNQNANNPGHVHSVLVGADKIIGKGYRYISDHVSKGVAAGAAAIPEALARRSNDAQVQESSEDDEEEDLFEQLLIEEKNITPNEKPVEEIESNEKLMKMMEEGVVEDPHVDSDDDSNGSDNLRPSAAESTIVVEGLHVAPSKEELESGKAILLQKSGVDEFVEEQTEGGESEEDEKDDISEEALGSIADQGMLSSTDRGVKDSSTSLAGDQLSLYLSGPFVKGPLNFKMVNNHFLALMDAFKFAGWTRMHETSSVSDLSLLITKPVTPVIGSSSKMISQISHSSCLGGTKGTQLSCRSKFASEHGCAFESLRISPLQYNMWKQLGCEKFFEVALRPENTEKQWIGKVGASYHGRHITIYTGVTKSIKTHYGKCKVNRDSGGGYIMMEYVSNPALLDNRKFDLRTFLLIANTQPFLAFYHKGFVRRSANRYSSDLSDKLAHVTNHEGQASEDHFMGFPDLEAELHKQLGFAADYMRVTFEPRAKKITNYVFQAARSRLKRKLGAFQLFGLDWMIDTKGGLHLLEGNGNPVVKHYPDTNSLTPQVWRDMASLLTSIHMASAQRPDHPFGPLLEGFKHGGWELVFSELEETASGRKYNPCDAGLQ